MKYFRGGLGDVICGMAIGLALAAVLSGWQKTVATILVFVALALMSWTTDEGARSIG